MSPSCSHCGGPAEQGWQQDDLLQMMSDGAYPPSVCGGCWYSVAASAVDEACTNYPAACTHRVRT